MRPNWNSVGYVIAFVIILMPCRCVSDDTQLETTLQKRIEYYEMSEQSFLQALMRLATESGVPMGIEWIETPITMSPVHQRFSNMTILQMLQNFLKSYSGYAMNVNNGVVHIFPSGPRDEQTSFLNIYVDKFEVRNEYVAVASYRLRQKIREILNPPLPTVFGKPAGVAFSITSGLGDQRISFTVTKVRIKDILDKFASMSQLKIWVVTYGAKPDLVFGRIRKTKSIFTDKVIDDGEQPIWGRFVWGFDPVSHNLRQDWYLRKLTP
jgi:hypothetical protein